MTRPPGRHSSGSGDGSGSGPEKGTRRKDSSAKRPGGGSAGGTSGSLPKASSAKNPVRGVIAKMAAGKESGGKGAGGKAAAGKGSAARGANGSARRESLVKALSQPPQKRWPDGFLHHGSRLGLLLGLSIFLTLVFPPVTRTDVSRYEVGMVADNDIIAQIPFGVPKSAPELERDREQAAAAVPPTFEARAEAADSMRARVSRFFSRIEAASSDEGFGPATWEVLSDVGIAASNAQIRLLSDLPTMRVLRGTVFRAVDEILPNGVVDPSQAEAITTDRIILRGAGDDERYVPRDSLLSVRDFYDRAIQLLPATASPDMNDLLRLILIRFLEPSFVLDASATELDRAAARNTVATTKASILAGEAIVRANQQIGPNELERLNAYEEGLRNQGRLEEAGLEVAPIAGSVLLNLLVLGIFGLFFYFFRQEIYSNFRWMLLIALLVMAYFGAAVIMASNNLPPELLPIAFVSLAVAVLWDSRAALVLALILAVLTGAQPPFGSYPILITTLVGGAAAALSVRAVRRRAQTWVFIAIITAAYAGVILALGLVFRSDPQDIALAAGWAGVNATGSAILAMGFLPVFEWFTRITTDQTLLEWADPNRPLLKRLSLEAPGTYAHTISLANLSEAAANAIGANGLLCRVGVYYHDVGKILKPHYFIENQPGSRNPHDKLKPEHSATIIREHVTEGIRLAKEAKLPEALLRFIPEHHGTQKISFFYEKAKEEGAEELKYEDFCYPGPRPQTRETAIVMLADSVESATRSLQDPTRERLEELIESIVDTKIRDGQLEDAPLTLRELRIIKEQFRKVLGGMYHHRIDYPATKHLTDAPGSDGAAPAGEPGERGEAASTASEGAASRTPSGPEPAVVPGASTADAPPMERPAGRSTRDGADGADDEDDDDTEASEQRTPDASVPHDSRT